MITKQEYTKRRSIFLHKMKNNSVAVLFSGTPIKASADECYPFEVNRNFYYLTGIQQAESMLVFVKSAGNVNIYLFIEEVDPYRVKWTGKMLSFAEASEISGVKDILPTKHFQAKLQLFLDGQRNAYGRIENIYLDLESGLYIANEKTTKDYAFELSRKYPGLVCLDAYKMIVEERMIKSSAEIEEIRQSIQVTQLGLEAIMKKLKPGLYEYQISSLFRYTVANFNHSGLAFPTICAGGENATILHYPTPDGLLKANTLLLLDLGAEKNLYRADISRTYPVSGTFKGREKEIYEMVLHCNKAVANFVRPGITLADVHNFSFEFLKSELISRGYISAETIRKEADKEIEARELIAPLTEAEKEDIYKGKMHDAVYKYYYHNVTHHLGLDTHDASFRDMKFEPGMVITDEPGLYFAEYGIGVRIEDDLLVLENGAEVLSKDIIKEIEDIEHFMQGSKKETKHE